MISVDIFVESEDLETAYRQVRAGLEKSGLAWVSHDVWWYSDWSEAAPLAIDAVRKKHGKEPGCAGGTP